MKREAGEPLVTEGKGYRIELRPNGRVRAVFERGAEDVFGRDEQRRSRVKRKRA